MPERPLRLLHVPDFLQAEPPQLPLALPDQHSRQERLYRDGQLAVGDEARH